MDNVIIWSAITITSFAFGFVHYKAGYYTDIDKHNGYFKSLEFFRFFANYFVTSAILYYFISVRDITEGGNLSFGDTILAAVFLVGLFGWLPYFVRNLTEGINAILSRILNK